MHGQNEFLYNHFQCIFKDTLDITYILNTSNCSFKITGHSIPPQSQRYHKKSEIHMSPENQLQITMVPLYSDNSVSWYIQLESISQVMTKQLISASLMVMFPLCN